MLRFSQRPGCRQTRVDGCRSCVMKQLLIALLFLTGWNLLILSMLLVLH